MFFCHKHKHKILLKVRKYFNCGAFLFQTVFMMLAAFLLHPVWSVLCIIIAVGLGAFAWCGFAVNHLDIAPRHASVLMGITNTLATIPGIVSPTLTGVLVKNKAIITIVRLKLIIDSIAIYCRVKMNGELFFISHPEFTCLVALFTGFGVLVKFSRGL